MSWTTVSIELNENQTQKRSFWCQWTFSLRRSRLYILITVGYRDNLDCYNILSLFFWYLLHEESFTLYILLWTIFIIHLLIIRTLTWVPVPSDTPSGFSMSCGSQGSIVQRSSPHKCSQKSSCSAFNEMVATFP